MALLKTTDLSILFGGLKAVSDLNLEINSGEIVGAYWAQWCWKLPRLIC